MNAAPTSNLQLWKICYYNAFAVRWARWLFCWMLKCLVIMTFFSSVSALANSNVRLWSLNRVIFKLLRKKESIWIFCAIILWERTNAANNSINQNNRCAKWSIRDAICISVAQMTNEDEHFNGKKENDCFCCLYKLASTEDRQQRHFAAKLSYFHWMALSNANFIFLSFYFYFVLFYCLFVFLLSAREQWVNADWHSSLCLPSRFLCSDLEWFFHKMSDDASLFIASALIFNPFSEIRKEKKSKQTYSFYMSSF